MLTIVMAYYMNPGMLAEHYKTWAAYPAAVKEAISAVVVDDGSPTGTAAKDVPRPDGLPALRLFRVLEDRPWHQDAARNIGVSQAETDWILVTDMDQLLTLKSAQAMLRIAGGTWRAGLRPKVYIPSRVNAPALTKYPEHCNSYLLQRTTFWKAGGYDEDLCGCYGTDGDFRRRLQRAGLLVHLRNVPLVRYSRDVIPDASTTTLERRTPAARAEKQRIFDRKEALARNPQVLQCAWERQL